MINFLLKYMRKFHLGTSKIIGFFYTQQMHFKNISFNNKKSKVMCYEI